MSFKRLLNLTCTIYRKGYNGEIGAFGRTTEGDELWEFIQVPNMVSVPTRIDSRLSRVDQRPEGQVRVQTGLAWFDTKLPNQLPLNLQKDDRIVDSNSEKWQVVALAPKYRVKAIHHYEAILEQDLRPAATDI